MLGSIFNILNVKNYKFADYYLFNANHSGIPSVCTFYISLLWWVFLLYYFSFWGTFSCYLCFINAVFPPLQPFLSKLLSKGCHHLVFSSFQQEAENTANQAGNESPVQELRQDVSKKVWKLCQL